MIATFFHRSSKKRNEQCEVSKGLRTSKLKTLPIPKQIPNRLYEIGKILIIEGKEDKELRKEADKIIEKLYEGLGGLR